MKKQITTALATGLGYLVATPAFATQSYGVNTSIKISGYGTNDPETVIVNALNFILGILALIAVILVLIGGFQWMAAAGNEDKVDKAKKILVAAIIGLVIIMAAWGFSLYAVGILASVTGASTY